MPQYKIECQYCGNRWEEYFYSEHALIDTAKCPKCNDKGLKITQKEASDVFGYNKK